MCEYIFIYSTCSSTWISVLCYLCTNDCWFYVDCVLELFAGLSLCPDKPRHGQYCISALVLNHYVSYKLLVMFCCTSFVALSANMWWFYCNQTISLLLLLLISYVVNYCLEIILRTSHLTVFLSQGVYKFNWTNFQEISRRDFKKNPGHVCIASACYVPNLLLHVMDAVYPVLSLF